MSPLPLVLDRSLPENIRYKDDGCRVHPECKTCPLSQCIFDQPARSRNPLNVEHDRRVERVRSLKAQGLTPLEIAAMLGIHKRSVWRYLRPES